jgi:hypothetical protein
MNDGHVVMIFYCFVWLAWKKSDNTTLEKQFRKRSNWQNFCNSFSVHDLIKVQQTNITTRKNGTMNSQKCTQVLDLIKVQQGFHKEQWYYEFPTMYVSLVPEVQQRISGTKTTKIIGTGSQRM